MNYIDDRTNEVEICLLPEPREKKIRNGLTTGDEVKHAVMKLYLGPNLPVLWIHHDVSNQVRAMIQYLSVQHFEKQTEAIVRHDLGHL